VAPYLQLGVVGSLPDMGCMVLQPFAARGNRSYPEFWAVTGGLRYPGYITSTVATKPSIERVAEASHSTVGGTGTHMVLWLLLRDSAVILRG
jgi:hypothetical protein